VTCTLHYKARGGTLYVILKVTSIANRRAEPMVHGFARNAIPSHGCTPFSAASPIRTGTYELDSLRVDYRAHFTLGSSNPVSRLTGSRRCFGFRGITYRLAQGRGLASLTAATLLAGAILAVVVAHVITD
jgi:hypothetical protein